MEKIPEIDLSSLAARGKKAFFALAAAAAVFGGFLVWWTGSANQQTPAGYVGYLTQRAVFGKTTFYGLQDGPTSSGRVWMLDVINTSITPYTYTENFTGDTSVLSKDNLKISFSVHVIWRIKREDIKNFVEKYTTLQRGDSADKTVQVAYSNYLREPIRTYARDEVQKLNGLLIKDKITEVGNTVLDRTRKLTNGTPFEVMSIVVGNIQYPEEVANSVALKLKYTQDLERKGTEVEIEKQEKEKRIIQAEGIARAMEIINSKLTAGYLQHEAIEAQKMMVGSQNHTTIYIPVGPMGVPIVGTMDLGRVLPGAPASPAQPARPSVPAQESQEGKQ